MATAKRKTATKRAATRAKPKSARNASAKRVKRTTTAAKKTAQRTTTAAASNTKTAAKNADAVMKSGADTIRQMMDQISKSGMQDDMQKQIYSMSQESAAQLAKSADTASKSMNEMMELGKDNMDAAVACGSIAVNASKSMGAEMFNYANKSFSQNVEMSKEIFGCRTLNDMFDLQSKVVKANLDHFFNESVKMSEMIFQSANEISEPLNERVSESTQRMSKVMAEAS